MPETRPYMTDAAADALMRGALDRLFGSEPGLPPDVSERTVVGLFSRHLASELGERPIVGGRWRVDCEYNRLGLDPKRVPQLHEMFVDLAASCEASPDEVSCESRRRLRPSWVL